MIYLDSSEIGYSLSWRCLKNESVTNHQSYGYLMYEYQIPVQILPRLTLGILMESTTICFARYLATDGGTSLHTWTM